MASEKVARILRAKSKFSEPEIQALSDAQAWAWIYDQRARKTKEKLDQICFTGFNQEERLGFESRAQDAHLEVVKSVTKSLRFLCTGPNAGPAKLEKARAQNVLLLTVDQFENLIETGEIPSE